MGERLNEVRLCLHTPSCNNQQMTCSRKPPALRLVGINRQLARERRDLGITEHVFPRR